MKEEKEKVEEKKEKHTNKHPAKKGQYLAVAAIIVVIAVIAAAIVIFYYPKQTPPQTPPSKPPSAKVNVIIVYSSQCTVCDKTNSILLFLDQKNIPYELGLLDETTVEGKKAVKDYNIAMVPTALVDANSLALYALTDKVFAGQFQKVKGKYVVPERFYDNIPGQIMFLQPPSDECNVQKGIVTVDELFDFMCPSCNKALPEVDRMKSDFGKEMLHRYRDYVLGGAPSERIAVAYECARLQTDGNEYLHGAFDAIFGEKTPLRDLIAIDQNTRNYVVTSDENFTKELEKIAVDSNVPDINAFNKCYANGETFFIAGTSGTNAIFGGKYQAKWIPTFIIDCQYVVSGADPVIEGQQTTISKAVCLLHPELKACAGK